MPSLTVMTWNVLHRIHGHNWNEAAVRGEPDEGRRLAGISRLIVEQLGEGPAVVCLQEVSGDQLASLRGQLPPDAALFNHPYPRMPRVKDPASITAPLLTDPSEHLAVVVRGLPSPRVVAARTYPNDQGKGMLVVEAGAFTICCTHVTWAEKGRSQLELLAAQAQGAPGTAIVAGDFNAPLEEVHAALGAALQVADLSRETLRTRTGKDRDIDHLLVMRGRVSGARVLDCGLLSDHRPVTASVSSEG